MGPDENGYGLCGLCRRELDAVSDAVSASGAFSSGGKPCGHCGRPLISESETCLSCRNGGKSGVDRAAVIYPYSGKYRGLLASYKFGKNLALGRFFAEKIIGALARLSLSGAEGAVFVPVPPRPGKIRKAGWDQVERLAVFLEKAGKNHSAILPVHRCLRRLRSASQKELDGEARRKNLAGRIIATRNVPPVAVLFDDVMTTGSTLEACAGALKTSGTQKVYGICLFYN